MIYISKYDYEAGRFNSFDPLWEKYYGWTPYQYCMNNPIWAKDWNGKALQGAALSAPAAGGILIGVGL